MTKFAFLTTNSLFRLNIKTATEINNKKLMNNAGFNSESNVVSMG